MMVTDFTYHHPNTLLKYFFLYYKNGCFHTHKHTPQPENERTGKTGVMTAGNSALPSHTHTVSHYPSEIILIL